MIFKVGTTDFTNNVVIGSYEVNKTPVYDEWVDIGGKIHRIKIRDKIQGSFEVFFKTMTAYSTFKTAIDNNTSSTNLATTVSVKVNNTNTDATGISAYLDFLPVRDVNGTRNDFLKVIQINLEER